MKESFKDEDTGESVEIKRTQIVRIDGEWVMDITKIDVIKE